MIELQMVAIGLIQEQEAYAMLSDLKISTRLMIMWAFFLAGLVIVGVSGLYSSAKLNRAMQSIHDDRMMPTLHLNAIHTANLNNVLVISRAIADPGGIGQYIQEIDKNKSFIDNEWRKYTAILERDVKDKAEDKILTEKFIEVRRQFFEEGIKPAMAALRVNNLDEAKRIQNENIFPLIQPLHEALSALVNMETNEVILAHEEGEALYGKIRSVSIFTILLSVILGGTFGFSIIRGVNRAVGELRGVMARMSGGGDLSERAKVYGKDEIGAVTDQFNALLDNMNNLSELKPVFDNLDEGVVFIDQQRHVRAINKAACRLLGQDSDAAFNKLCPDIFQGMDCARECKKNDRCTRMHEAKPEENFQDVSVKRPDNVLVGLRLLAIGLPSKGSLVIRGSDW